MTRETTYKKIRDIESKYGSLVNALESNAINYSTYYRYRTISMTIEYAEYVYSVYNS